MPLFVVVLAGVVISYQWASDLVYRAAGEVPPVAPPRPPPNANNAPAPAAVSFSGLDGLMHRAQQHRSDWQTINVRLPKDGRTAAETRNLDD